MTEDALQQAELLQGLRADEVQRLMAIARPQSLAAGEYLFLLGDHADRLYVVMQGSVDLCFPMPLGGVVKDLTVETAVSGQTMGWSALVKPYRFTLTGRATEPTRVMAFARHELLGFFSAEPRIGYTLMTRIAELSGIRLLKVQALWARELQRNLAADVSRAADAAVGSAERK